MKQPDPRNKNNIDLIFHINIIPILNRTKMDGNLSLPLSVKRMC
jgi:hypothetical protein